MEHATAEHPWYSEEAGYFGRPFLEEYGSWMTPEITRRQVAFTEACLGLDAGSSILDLACGVGRHTLLLSRHGFRLTGLDLNRSLVERARASARLLRLAPRWVVADMRALPFEGHFDAVVSLFTSFGFLGDEENEAVVRQVAKSLRPNGRFVLDVMNRDFVLHHMKREETRSGVDGSVWAHRRDFDPVTKRLRHRRLKIGSAGKEGWESIVRLYSHEELATLFRRSGLQPRQVYGGLWRV